MSGYTYSLLKKDDRFYTCPKTEYEKLPWDTGTYIVVLVAQETGHEMVYCLKEYGDTCDGKLYNFSAERVIKMVTEGYLQIQKGSPSYESLVSSS